jgi:hypothetical protein
MKLGVALKLVLNELEERRRSGNLFAAFYRQALNGLQEAAGWHVNVILFNRQAMIDKYSWQKQEVFIILT